MENVSITLYVEGNQYYEQIVTDFDPEAYSVTGHTVTEPQQAGDVLLIEIDISSQAPANLLVDYEVPIGTFPDPQGIDTWDVEVIYKENGQQKGEKITTTQEEAEALPKPIGPAAL